MLGLFASRNDRDDRGQVRRRELCERLTDERLKALIEVFSQGSVGMKIRTDPARAAELKDLLARRVEPDTACWVDGHVNRLWSHESMPGGNCFCCSSDLKSAYVGGRRHHCRRCGRLVCSDCSKTRMHLWFFWGQDEESGLWEKFVVNHEAAFTRVDKPRNKPRNIDEGSPRKTFWSRLFKKSTEGSRPRRGSSRF